MCSGLDFSGVVLDFLFCCHNLNMDCLWGDAPRSFHGQGRPVFQAPQRKEKHGDRLRVKKGGAGSHFETKEGGIQAGQPGRRGTISTRNETQTPFPSHVIRDLALRHGEDAMLLDDPEQLRQRLDEVEPLLLRKLREGVGE